LPPEGKKRFKDDPLKLERIDDLKEDEVISVYTDGPFVDLCRGPHVPDTGRVKHYKLTHTAGAYWRGDSKRQMLQREIRELLDDFSARLSASLTIANGLDGFCEGA